MKFPLLLVCVTGTRMHVGRSRWKGVMKIQQSSLATFFDEPPCLTKELHAFFGRRDGARCGCEPCVGFPCLLNATEVEIQPFSLTPSFVWEFAFLSERAESLDIIVCRIR